MCYLHTACGQLSRPGPGPGTGPRSPEPESAAHCACAAAAARTLLPAECEVLLPTWAGRA